MQLHEKLVILRKENQLTQQKVAEELNVSRQAISRWESGVSLPSTDNLKGLSTLYHVPVDYLLHDSTERTAPIEKTVNPTSNANNNKLKKAPNYYCLYPNLHLSSCCYCLHYKA